MYDEVEFTACAQGRGTATAPPNLVAPEFWDTATYWLKIANFSYPLSFNALVRGEPYRISGWTFYSKNKSPWAICGEDFVILAGVVFTQRQRVTNRQSDRRTDNPTVANTGLCIASYADAL